MGYIESYDNGDSTYTEVGPQDIDSPMQNFLSWPKLNPEFVDMSELTDSLIPKYKIYIRFRW